jgi:hypothetical protein
MLYHRPVTPPLSSDGALDALAALGPRALGRVTLAFHRGEGFAELASELEAAARRVSAAARGAIAVVAGSGAGPPGLPALSIRADGRDVVHYLAAPAGPEEAPFLEVISNLAGGDRSTGAATGLAGLRTPAELMVFVSPDCPSCPASVRAATSLATSNRLVTASVVDVTRFAEHTRFFDVRSVPTTVVDGEAFFVGVTPVAELAELLVRRDGPEKERSVFETQLVSGRFDDAARRLADGRAAEAFVEIWRESSLEQRIGLVLTADRALEDDPGSLDGLVPRLLPVLATPDPARRGDTADLLGKIGHPDAAPGLKALAGDPDPDVAEAAGDALERIAERTAREELHGSEPA